MVFAVAMVKVEVKLVLVLLVMVEMVEMMWLDCRAKVALVR